MNISMAPTTLLSQYIFTDLSFTIGFGVLHGYAGIRHTTGDIILIGGDHTIA